LATVQAGGERDEAGAGEAFKGRPLKGGDERGQKVREEGEGDAEGTTAALVYSAVEALRERDFGSFTRDEVEEARRLIKRMTWHTGARATRRRVRAPSRGMREFFDFRATTRQNLRFGGELLDLAWKRPRYRPRPLVVLCDISGSMEAYSRMLLHFVHELGQRTAQTGQAVEAFVFSTRLTRITRALRTRSVERALSQVARAVPDWSGGTRIGEMLRTFNYAWSRRVVRPGAVVLIISDGWDRGDPRLVAQEMARLKRNVHRVIWLNPLMGSAEYEPLTRGLTAARPFVDDFLPAHNLKSLEGVVRELEEG
jgi:uncharacterized protein with von Willebrand factor type A (vWA) domain